MKYRPSVAIEVYKVLSQYSDENNPITREFIKQKLNDEDIDLSDDVFEQSIKQIKEQLDADIVSTKGRYAKYYLNSRLFEKSELKLMIDAINTSPVINESAAESINERMKKLLSKYEANELDRSASSVAKTSSKRLIYNIDAIQNALKDNKVITFDYLKWNKNKRLEKNKKYNGQKTLFEPWELFWANDKYYLFGFKVDLLSGEPTIRHYRVDKMANIESTDMKRQHESLYKRFDPKAYVTEHYEMYGDKVEQVVITVPEEKIGIFIDKFGIKISVKERKDGLYNISFRVTVSDLFLGWLLGIGDVLISQHQPSVLWGKI